eukprot:11947-Heterococcus_DN1.PRE.3
MDIHLCGPFPTFGGTSAQWGALLQAALPAIGWAYLGSHTRPIAGAMVRFDFYQQTGGAAAQAVPDSAMRVFGNPIFGAQRRDEFESIVKNRIKQAASENSSSREGLYKLIADSWSAFPPAVGLAVPASFDEALLRATLRNVRGNAVLLVAQCPLRELSVVTDTAKRAPTTKVERAIEAVLPDHVVYLNARDHCVRTSTGCAAVAFNSTEFEVRSGGEDCWSARQQRSSTAAQQLITGSKAQVEGIPALIDSGYFGKAVDHVAMPLSLSSHPKHGQVSFLRAVQRQRNN